jgi:hypothetical protein
VAEEYEKALTEDKEKECSRVRRKGMWRANRRKNVAEEKEKECSRG